MRTKLVQKAIIAALLAAGCNVASANAIAYQGVTFTATRTADSLKLRIDAASPTGDWAGATTLGALEVGSIGSFTGFTFSSNLPAVAGWSGNGRELTANGCAAANQPTKNACIYGTHVALANDMEFTFTFTGNAFNLGDPSVKVNFFTGDGTGKVGSLLSQNIVATQDTPPNDVPEPKSLALLAGGASMMAALARRRRSGKD